MDSLSPSLSLNTNEEKDTYCFLPLMTVLECLITWKYGVRLSMLAQLGGL